MRTPSLNLLADRLYRSDHNGTQVFAEICRRRGVSQDYMEPPQLDYHQGSMRDQCAVFNDWLENQGWPRLYGTTNDTRSARYWQWDRSCVEWLQAAWKAAGYNQGHAGVDVRSYFPNGVENTISISSWPQNVIPRRSANGFIYSRAEGTTTAEAAFVHANRMRTAFGEAPMLLPEYVRVLRQHGWVVPETMRVSTGPRARKPPVPEVTTTLQSVKRLTDQARPVFELISFMQSRRVLLSVSGIANGQYFWEDYFGEGQGTQVDPFPQSIVYPVLLTLVEMGVLERPRRPELGLDAIWEYTRMYEDYWPPELPRR